MYIYTKDTKYTTGNKYYSYSSSTDEYVLLEAGTDYTIGNSIPANSVYSYYEYDKLYIKSYGGTGYYEFPYVINGRNTLPVHTKGANDVDLDSYTNTAGRTVRNRVRHDVATIEFNIPTMSGNELKNVFAYSTDVWCSCFFFFEPEWDFVEKKMYRSATVKYSTYYIDGNDPLNNTYTDIQFSFVEE